MAVSNLLPVMVEGVDGGQARLRAASGAVLLSTAPGFRAGETAWVGVRPERMRLLHEDETSAAGAARVEGVLEDRVYRGDRTDWRVRAGELVLVVGDPGRNGFRPGHAVRVAVPAEDVLRLEDGAPPSAP
jgi:hypothetical protein